MPVVAIRLIKLSCVLSPTPILEYCVGSIIVTLNSGKVLEIDKALIHPAVPPPKIHMLLICFIILYWV